MAVEPLIRALEREARDEARALLERARLDADRLAEEAAAEEKERLDRELSRSTAELRAAAEARRATASLGARRRLLDTRRRLLDRVLAAASSRLPRALADPEGEAITRRLLDAALDSVGERPAEVRCPRALEETVRRLLDALPDGPVRRLVVDDAVGSGVLLVTDDGRLRVDGTLEGRLTTLRARLEIEVAGALEALAEGGSAERREAPGSGAPGRPEPPPREAP